jgi:hypothetical protein
MRSRSKLHGAMTEVVPSTDELLRATSSALRGEREKLRALASAARKRLEDQLGQRVPMALGRRQAPSWNGSPKQALDQALAQLRKRVGTPADGSQARDAHAAVAPRGARLGAPAPLPPPTLRPVKIRLPNHRWVRGHLAPAAARRDDLEVLRRITASNTERAFAAIQHNARAIDSLATSQHELAKLVAELQARCDPLRLEALFDVVARLELRFRKCRRSQKRALASHRRSVSRQQGALRKTLRLQARSASIQKLNAAATSMQVAAFGTKGNPLAKNNLLVAGNELLWGFFGELLERLGLKQPGQTSAWGWLLPVASLASGQVALGSQQHQRFVSGVATHFAIVGNNAMFSRSLERDIAARLWPSFRRRDDVPVTTVALEPLVSVLTEARVKRGVLTIIVASPDGGEFITTEDLVDARIAWTVDTGVAGG